MASLLVLLVVISSGSFFGAFVLNRKYEEIIPITVSGMILVLFIFGILDLLDVGVVAVVAICLLIYIFSIIKIISRKSENKNLLFTNFITPGFVAFVLAIIACSIFINGKVFDLYDELSHWGDVVKAMLTTGHLSAHTETHSTLPSYPPAMALFQYFYQKIGLLFGEFAVISEWRCILSYNIFVLSFAMPAFRNTIWRHWWKALISIIIIMFAPLFYYSYAFTSVMIDFSLAAITGAGIMTIALHKKNDKVYFLNIIGTCLCLVLLKDAGLLFAGIIGICSFVNYFYEIKHDYSIKSHSNKMVSVYGIAILGSIVIPKALWEICMKINHTPQKISIHITIDDIISVFSGGQDNYRRETFISYIKRIMTDGLNLGNTGIKITYFCLILIILVISCYVLNMSEKKNAYYAFRKKSIIICLSLMIISHIIGLCFTYLFVFNEWEALNLASFTRYINIPLCACHLALVYIILSLKNDWKTLTSIILVVALLTPMESVCNYFARTTVKYSITERQQYDEITKKIDAFCDTDDRVLLVSNDDGFDYYNIRYIIRPKEEIIIWDSLNKGNTSPDEWKDTLLEQYDYVALYDIGDTFIEDNSYLFDKQEEIENDCLYKIDKEKDTLVKIA